MQPLPRRREAIRRDRLQQVIDGADLITACDGGVGAVLAGQYGRMLQRRAHESNGDGLVDGVTHNGFADTAAAVSGARGETIRREQVVSLEAFEIAMGEALASAAPAVRRRRPW